MTRYGGGISRARIAEILALPMSVVVRLLGVARRNSDPNAPMAPTQTEAEDAEIIAKLEAKIKAAKETKE